ncbi:MAG TPA: hypothetical protein VEA69_02920 [Tepidisphaeraceae bacterium]|nr:hypothetical protein [Tepidisphaeraceae bacterium]
MLERIEIGSSPPAEDCAQVGSEDYVVRARRECRAYIGQLRRALRPEPDGVRLAIQSNPHDFGTYLSVVCHYDPGVAAAIDYAFRCESDGPQEWDDAARAELNLNPGSRPDSERS